MRQQERRREPRFEVRQAARVIVSKSRELSAVTRNLSAHGLLLHLNSRIPKDSEVEVILALKLTPSSRDLRLVYQGKVVRTERQSTKGEFAVAVACNDPARVSS